MFLTIGEKTDLVIEKARQLGFSDIGFSRAEYLPRESSRLTDWLKKGNHGEMSYMEDHFDKRTNPVKLVPGAKTVISLSYNYYTDVKQADPDAPVISVYAYGRDYHKVIKKKLKNLLILLQERIGVEHGRGFVDSGPVLERAWAERSGLGWVGKNTMVIHPKKGSYFFLAELIIDVELAYSEPIDDHCGRCRRCIDACPTAAIDPQGYKMDGGKCISYATIEKKGEIPDFFRDKMENRVFGCDICIEVCPWNKFASKHDEPDFEPKRVMLELTAKDWSNLSESDYEELFNGTPVRRTKFKGLKRNIKFLDPNPE